MALQGPMRTEYLRQRFRIACHLFRRRTHVNGLFYLVPSVNLYLGDASSAGKQQVRGVTLIT